MPQPRTPAVKIVLTVSVSHCGSPSCTGWTWMTVCPAITLIAPTTPICQSRRRVATDTAASTAGPAATPRRPTGRR